MKWRSIQQGDTREVRRFAWLPVECHEGVTVWLELYTAVERYEFGFERAGWTVLRRIPT